MENPIFTGMQPGLYMKIIKSNMILIEFTTMFLFNVYVPKPNTTRSIRSLVQAAGAILLK